MYTFIFFICFWIGDVSERITRREWNTNSETPKMVWKKVEVVNVASIYLRKKEEEEEGECCIACGSSSCMEEKRKPRNTNAHVSSHVNKCGNSFGEHFCRSPKMSEKERKTENTECATGPQKRKRIETLSLSPPMNYVTLFKSEFLCCMQNISQLRRQVYFFWVCCSVFVCLCGVANIRMIMSENVRFLSFV